MYIQRQRILRLAEVGAQHGGSCVGVFVIEGRAANEALTVGGPRKIHSYGPGEAFAFRGDRSMPQQEITRKVTEVLEMVDLPGTEDKKPAELSGGMKKRVGLARAIIYEPAIVLYDEPTTGLDPIVSDSIDQLILRVRDRLDVTTVVVTHDMRSARRLGQRIMMLHERRIYATGTPDQIFQSEDPVVRRFVEGVSDPKEIYF